jgi:putative transposase
MGENPSPLGEALR